MKIQTAIIKDSIDLYKGDELVKSVPFKFNALTSMRKVQHLRNEVMNKNLTGDLEATGKAFWDLLCIIFGEDACLELDDWYDGDYLTMMGDIAPILTDVIYPAVDRLSDEVVQMSKRGKR